MPRCSRGGSRRRPARPRAWNRSSRPGTSGQMHAASQAMASSSCHIDRRQVDAFAAGDADAGRGRQRRRVGPDDLTLQLHRRGHRTRSAAVAVGHAVPIEEQVEPRTRADLDQGQRSVRRTASTTAPNAGQQRGTAADLVRLDGVRPEQLGDLVEPIDDQRAKRWPGIAVGAAVDRRELAARLSANEPMGGGEQVERHPFRVGQESQAAPGARRRRPAPASNARTGGCTPCSPCRPGTDTAPRCARRWGSRACLVAGWSAGLKRAPW